MREASIGLVAALVLGGCLLGPALECDDGRWREGLTCDGVMAAATTQLAGTAGIAKLTASEAIICPDPPQPCPPASFDIAVYADLADGRQLLVTVVLEDDGGLRARPPEPVEP